MQHMKKILYTILLSALIFWGEKTNAQGTWAVGLQFGENLTSLTGDAASEYRLGFSVGAHASHYLTENMVLRLEVNFERKGAERVYDRNDPFAPNVPSEIRLDYLSLPVMLRYSTTGTTKFAAGGGVAVSYLTNEVSPFEDAVAVQTDDFNRVDADLIACAGVAHSVSEHLTLSFELRSNLGLVDVERNRGTARQLGRNVSWGLLIGLNYYL